MVGGVWGLWEGVKTPEGRTVRLRMNSVLNGCTRRGPFLGNTLAVLGEPLPDLPMQCQTDLAGNEQDNSLIMSPSRE